MTAAAVPGSGKPPADLQAKAESRPDVADGSPGQEAPDDGNTTPASGLVPSRDDITSTRPPMAATARPTAPAAPPAKMMALPASADAGPGTTHQGATSPDRMPQDPRRAEPAPAEPSMPTASPSAAGEAVSASGRIAGDRRAPASSGQDAVGDIAFAPPPMAASGTGEMGDMPARGDASPTSPTTLTVAAQVPDMPVAAVTSPSPSIPQAAATPAVPLPQAGPAQQAAPALISLVSRPGAQQVTVRLDPVELGGLQIRIERRGDGPTRIILTTERAATAELLQRDQPALHRALDQAGLPADGRSIEVRVAAASPDVASGASTALSGVVPSAHAAAPHAAPATTQLPAPQAGTDASGGSAQANAGADHGAGGFTQRDTGPGSRNHRPASLLVQDDDTAPARWLRAGIDITA
ncbi:flagellar hook-length control protein FliK [Rhodovastum atsumiense]|uniref:flagellar hook-length control protein FliK n=1 Tax=Rhodovastum atsumiense TaxID=504468 RepID=UPI00139F2A35|nr:flagellar hook-length control protein FliK [Rhodovastum atsumiense]